MSDSRSWAAAASKPVTGQGSKAFEREPAIRLLPYLRMQRVAWVGSSLDAGSGASELYWRHIESES